MAELYGKTYARADLLRRVGNLAQVAGMREFTYSSGRADGVKAVEVNTGDFRFELLPSRCLDVAGAWYKGIPLGYFSKSGIRHPSYFRRTDSCGFTDSFLGGVLTTCGLHNIGPAAENAGRRHESHGGIANMPAEEICLRERWDGDVCRFSVGGVVRHGNFYDGDLQLRRRVEAVLGEPRFFLEDEVENLDFSPAPCLLLYHCQFGFPLLDAATRLVLPHVRNSWVRPGGAPEAMRDHGVFGVPADGAEETVFYHRFAPDSDGWAVACLFNPELGADGLGVYVKFDATTLPLLIQWKMLRSREYVCGLEPANARLDDRTADEMERVMLQPLEKRRFRLEIGVVEGALGVQSLAHKDVTDG